METSDFDKNFKTVKCDAGKFKVYSLPNPNFKLCGILYDEEGFHRLSKKDRSTMTEGIQWFQRHTSGGRILFSTNSRKIYLKVELFSLEGMPEMAQTGSAGFALKKVVKGKYLYYGVGRPDKGMDHFETSFVVSKSKRFSEYILYMPLYNNVKSVSIGIEYNTEIRESNLYRKDLAPILYYGSSITQGGCASRPDNSYEAYISEKYNMDYESYSFAGCCKGEPEVVDFLVKKNPSIFVLDFDHNAECVEQLEERHPKLFNAFRKTHPTTPIIVVSRPNYNVKGAVHWTDAKQRDIIMKTVNDAINNGDKNVYFVDGSKFYPSEVREHCSVDTCHPTDLGFYFMAKGIIKCIEKNKLIK